MKRTILLLSMAAMLLVCGNSLFAQDEPKPKKDTVNMDTHAKPETYYALEDEGSQGSEKSSTGTILIIAGAVIVVAGVGFFLMRKKK